MSNEFDVVILGGGSGGYACALRASQLGLRVALIEGGELGGTCLHRGCVPTKALLHVAELADGARHGAQFGVHSAFDGVDMSGVKAFKDRVVGRLHKGLQGLLASAGITVVEADGRLSGPRTVTASDREFSGGNVVLATGSHARTLPGVEVSGRILTSDQALSITEVPRKAVIIGGSVIGVEFASAWKSFGAEVTIVEALPSLVPLEDPALSRQLGRAFRKRGIGIRTGVRVDSVIDDGDQALVTLETGDVLPADVVLVAVGRGPNTTGLGYEEQGIALDRGWVVANHRLATTVDGVYAVGDLVRGLQLAHRGFAHGIFVAEEIAGLAPEPIVDSTIPRVTYCDPELSSVGLTEAQARELYGDAIVYEYNLAGNGKSQILGTTGFVKLVRQPDGPIVGVHMIGSRMGEQVGEAALIVNWEAVPEDVAAFIHAHPSQNEAFGEAALALAGKPLHAHG